MVLFLFLTLVLTLATLPKMINRLYGVPAAPSALPEWRAWWGSARAAGGLIVIPQGENYAEYFLGDISP